MRFAAISLPAAGTAVVAVAAATVCAAPTAPPSSARSDHVNLITVGKGVCFIEAGLNSTAAENFFDSPIGQDLSEIASWFGVKDLEASLGLESCDDELSGVSTNQLIADGLCYIDKGLGCNNIGELISDFTGLAIEYVDQHINLTAVVEDLIATGC